MFDFYGLYSIWFELGSGKEAYKIAVTQPTSARRQQLIDETFEVCTEALAKALPAAMLDAVKLELGHLEDETLVPTAAYQKWAAGTGDHKLIRLAQFGEVKLPANIFGELGWDRVRSILAAPFWQEHCDLYGGPAWAAILTKAVDLLDAYKQHLGILALVRRIDEIYDLEHNTGSLGTKLGDLAITKADLDVRARLTSTRSFINLASPPVKNLITASLGLLDKSRGSVVKAVPKPELWAIIHMDSPLQELAAKEVKSGHGHDAIMALKADVQAYAKSPADFEFASMPLCRPSDPRKRLFVGMAEGDKIIIHGHAYDKKLFNVEIYEAASPRDL